MRILALEPFNEAGQLRGDSARDAAVLARFGRQGLETTLAVAQRPAQQGIDGDPGPLGIGEVVVAGSDLLGATAKSPAMLFYLDNWMSAAPAAAKTGPPRGLNENYGRELLELHTLGVDGGYTQRDVVEVARCFTGWSMANPHDGLGFVFKPAAHDNGEKYVLGHRITAGRGIEDGEEVLDILARHPSTARFIATKLVRRFVADEPPRPVRRRRLARLKALTGKRRG